MIAHSQLNGRPAPSPARSAYDFVARNRWLVAGVPLFMLVATLIFVNWTTPVYHGVTTVRIDEERSNIAVLDALKELSQGASIYTEIAELRSRSVAEDVVDSLALHLVVQAPTRVTRASIFSAVSVDRSAPPGDYLLERTGARQFTLRGRGAEQRVQIGQPVRIAGGRLVLSETAANHARIAFTVKPFQEAVRDFRNTISVTRPEREADIVEIAYESTDRELTRAVPDATAALFIARRQNVKTQEARSTVAFLEDQLDTLGLQMRGLESGLQRFRESAGVINPEAEGEAQVNRLARMQADRDLAEAEFRSLSALVTEVQNTPVTEPDAPSPYRRLLGFPTILVNPAAAQLLASLNEVENERAELLTRLTPRDPDVQIMTGRIHELEEQLRSITTTYLQGLSNRIASQTAVLGRNAAELQRIPAKEIEYARLRRQAKVTEDIFTELQSRRKEAQIIAAVQDPTVRVIDPAILPIKAVKPNKPFSIALALMLGVALGLAAGFLRETLDTTIHTREDLQVESGALPVLGTIPRIREAGAGMNGERVWWRIRPAPAQLTPELRKSRLVAGRNPRGAASEAYRTLRTNIAFARAEKPAKTMVFTSPAPGEGKSTSSANLAITLAQQGLRVILIDADMRRGAIHEAFDVSQQPGLSDYLLSGGGLEDVIRAVQLEGAAFDFIPTGTLPPNPAELLASTHMQALLEHLDGEYDAVIFDAPPLNVVTDAAILGSRADGVILVVRAGVTDRAALRYSLTQLDAVRARVLGCVLNDVDTRRHKYHGAYIDDRYYEVSS